MIFVLVLAVAGCDSLEPSGAAEDVSADPHLAFELSTDRNDPPAAAGAMAPKLTSMGGSLVLSWLEPGHDGGHAFRFSELEESVWSDPSTIAEGDAFFANWADVPTVAVADNGLMVASWLAETGAEKYAYAPFWAHSRDSGETWTSMGTLNDDTTPTEHGFVSFIPVGAEEFQAVWLDGRQWMEDGPMALRTERVGVSGSEEQVLDARVCDCCPTAGAMTSRGPVVVYRDRSETEVRDIAIVRHVDGAWTEPRHIGSDGWQIAACPVNGPAIATAGDQVVVSWFTAAEQRPRVMVAFSQDAGATFGPLIEVDSESPLGRTSVVLDDAGGAIVSWLATSKGHADVRLRRVSSSGSLSRSAIVARTDATRASGYPRITRLGEWIAVAWVEAQEGYANRLRFGLVQVDAIPSI